MFKRFFGTRAPATSAVDVTEAQRRLDRRAALLIDVREPDEWQEGHVAGARHIPLGDLPARLAEVPRDRDVLLFCRSGNRSGRATALLRERGYERALNVAGGIAAWQRAGLPVTRGE